MLGAFSILYLIDDLDIVQLRGLVAKWVDAYGLFISALKDGLFGWIHLGWFSVDENEAHVIVVGGLFTAALGRAHIHHIVRVLRVRWLAAVTETVLLVLSIIILFTVLPSVLLPSLLGFVGAVIGLILLYIGCFARRTPNSRLPSPKLVAAEMMGTVGAFAVLVALNYALAQQ